MHNVHHLLALMRRVQAAIVEDRYPAFLREFFRLRYGEDVTNVPSWATTALKGVGVDLTMGGAEGGVEGRAEAAEEHQGVIQHVGRSMEGMRVGG